jgi:hypothetical protein
MNCDFNQPVLRRGLGYQKTAALIAAVKLGFCAELVAAHQSLRQLFALWEQNVETVAVSIPSGTHGSIESIKTCAHTLPDCRPRVMLTGEIYELNLGTHLPPASSVTTQCNIENGHLQAGRGIVRHYSGISPKTLRLCGIQARSMAIGRTGVR